VVNPVENWAAEAQFSKMIGRVHSIPVEETCLGWWTGGLRCCNAGMSGRARKAVLVHPTEN
jgi:hypothetical protein